MGDKFKNIVKKYFLKRVKTSEQKGKQDQWQWWKIPPIFNEMFLLLYNQYSCLTIYTELWYISDCDGDNMTSNLNDEAVVVVTIIEDDADQDDGVPLDTLDYKMVKMKLDT